MASTTRDDRYLDVAITPAGVTAGVVIDALVVKGGDGHNRYINAAVLRPASQPSQDYIYPLVGAGKVPQVSHWSVGSGGVELEPDRDRWMDPDRGPSSWLVFQVPPGHGEALAAAQLR